MSMDSRETAGIADQRAATLQPLASRAFPCRPRRTRLRGAALCTRSPGSTCPSDHTTAASPGTKRLQPRRAPATRPSTAGSERTPCHRGACYPRKKSTGPRIRAVMPTVHPVSARRARSDIRGSATRTSRRAFEAPPRAPRGPRGSPPRRARLLLAPATVDRRSGGGCHDRAGAQQNRGDHPRRQADNDASNPGLQPRPGAPHR